MTATLSCQAILTGEGRLVLACAGQLLERGHGIKAIVSRSKKVQEWCAAQGIKCADSFDQVDLNGIGLLISAGNLKLIPREILAQASVAAINFHDGPLPARAGLNVPVWALIEGETQHAVTWHHMSESADHGRVIATEMVPVDEHDTALSLNAKCFDAGISSFDHVLDAIQSGNLDGHAQHGQRRYFAKTKRPPNAATLDFSRPAAEIDRLVRALDHGQGYRNPLTLPKIDCGGLLAIAPVCELIQSEPAKLPGTVLGKSDGNLQIQTSQGAVSLSGLRAIDGSTLTSSRLPEIGCVLPMISSMPADLDDAVAVAARHEEFWEEALAAVGECEWPLAASSTGEQDTIRAKIDLHDLSRTGIVALFAAWWSCLTGSRQFSVSLRRSPPDNRWFDNAVPLNLHVSLCGPMADLCGHVDDAIADIDEAGFFAIDLPLRLADSGIVKRWRSARQIAIDPDGPALLGDARLLIARTARNSDSFELIAAAEFVTAAQLKEFARSLEAFAATWQADPARPIAELDLVHGSDRATMRGPAVELASASHPLAGLAQQAKTRGNEEALVCGTESLSFSRLWQLTGQFAAMLAAQGAGEGEIVAIHLERKPLLVVAALAAMRTGAAYLPLDPAYPSERLAFMAQDSSASLIVTERLLFERSGLASCGVKPVFADEWATQGNFYADDAIPTGLAYLIYTSGSTGRPKGVMVEHSNLANFCTGMDAAVGTGPGERWLAVTSLSFDISVLELFWTLSRGATVVLHQPTPATDSAGALDFSLFYFSGDARAEPKERYRLLLEGTKYADEHEFKAVWTPERHFHDFGGLFPNPAVVNAGLATMTKSIELRAGSCVLPLHHPVRAAEDLALIDNLSNGRVGVAFASGWQPNDFILAPGEFAQRKQDMIDGISTIRQLWRGESIDYQNPVGKEAKIGILPPPIQSELPIWMTIAGNPQSFCEAGELGCNVLTHLLGQTFAELAEKLRLYHNAWREAGHAGRGRVTLMLHTFVSDDADFVKKTVREPMKDYLRTAVDLVRKASWTFPTFEQKAKAQGKSPAEMFDSEDLSEEETTALLEHAFERYFATSGLFGTPDSCLAIVSKVKAIGVDEIACLIDFGIPADTVLENLPYLNALRKQSITVSVGRRSPAADILEHDCRYLQCTPSQAALLTADNEGRTALGNLDALLIGGEAAPANVVSDLAGVVPGRLLNMYGPTETTIWSSFGDLRTAPDSLGQPIANTVLRVASPTGQALPMGVPGELWIGGAGVATGYWQRPQLTAERFIDDGNGERYYRTGDLVVRHADGRLEFLGRLDNQVKIRGHRIELGEIETALTGIDGIQEAAVVALPDTAGNPQLSAFVVADQQIDGQSLLAALAVGLPEIMLPTSITQLDSMPLTPNGKLDRKALSARKTRRKMASPRTTAAEGALERQISEIWCDLLGLDEVAMDQNFFDLGGHSLLVIQSQRRLRDELGINLSITDMFRFTTIKALANAIRQQGAMRASRPADATRTRPESSGRYAIVGMSGRFPGAKSIDEFWQLLAQGREATRWASDDELLAAGVPAKRLTDPNYVRAVLSLDELEMFDHGFFGLNAREAAIFDPQHRHFLECCWTALEDAAHVPNRFDGRIGVFAGSGQAAYYARHILTNEELIEDVGLFLLRHSGNDKDFLTTRASYMLNLHGPSVAVQTACSTSLVAVHMALQSLREGACDMALAGGVTIELPHNQGYTYLEGEILSPDGHCGAFSQTSRGTLFGSGVGVVALRRLEDAITDQDHIHAVILGSAINNDGAQKAGYLAPSVEGQAEAVADAIADAGIDPATIGYVEAHGTGTPVGDPIELAALTQAFGRG